MVRRDHLVEAKLIKELPLISVLPPHHRRLSCRQLSRNHCSLGSSSPFSTAPANSRHCLTSSSVNHDFWPLASIDSAWAMNLCVGVGTPSFSPMRTRVPEK